VARLSWVASWLRWVSSTVWKSTRPAVVTLAGQPWRPAVAAVGGLLQAQGAFTVAAQGHQRVFHVLQGRQHVPR
jgi:hypothetical protein